MSDNNPFADQYPYYQSQSSSPKSLGKARVGVIIAVVFGCAAIFCCGLGTTVYFAIKNIAIGKVAAELPPRRDAFREEESKFNQSLASLKEPIYSDPELEQFIETSAQAAIDYADMPFSGDMFAEAVAASESATDIGPFERLLIKSDLAANPPTPYEDKSYFRILDVRAHGLLAEVDLLFFRESEAVSHQWFLVKESDEWKVYDWQILERGRRLSDEYAAYYSDASINDDGYDRAINLTNEALRDWYDDETFDGSKLRRAENTKMRSVDRPSALLQIAQVWMIMGKHQEGLGVLEKILKPDQLWGVWRAKAACHLELGNVDAAADAISKAELQSPHHPNLHSLKARLYEQQGKSEEAADSKAAFLNICRKETYVLYEIISAGRLKDVPLVVEIQLARLKDSDENTLESVLNWRNESDEWSRAFLAELENRKDDPSFPQGLLELVAAEQAAKKEATDEAASLCLKAYQLGKSSQFKDAALKRHATVRLAQDDGEQLVAETPDLESTLRLISINEYAYDANIFTQLLPVIEHQQRTGLWHDYAVGCGKFGAGQFQQSVDKLTAFLSEMSEISEMSETSEMYDDSESSNEIANHAKSLIVNALVQQGQPLEVMNRWPADSYMHSGLCSELLDHWDTTVLTSFVSSTTDNLAQPIAMIRLMVEAEIAFRSGDIELVNTKQRAAMQMVTNNEDEHIFDAQMTARRWAEMLACSPIDLAMVDLEMEGDVEHQNFSEIVMHGASESSILGDEAKLTQWLKKVENVGFEDARVEVLGSLAKLQAKRGDHHEAASTLAKAVELTGMDNEYRYYHVHQWFKQTLLASDFEKSAQIEDDPDAMFPRAATVELAKGELDKLRQRFADSSKLEVADWLSRIDQVHWLIRSSNQPGITQLITEYPLELNIFYPRETGLLIYPSNAKIDQERLSQVFEVAFPDDSFTLVKVANTANEGRLTSWIGTSTDGQRIAISLGADAFTGSCALPDQIRQQTKDGHQQLKFGILDYRPDCDQRLFAIAAQAAGDDALVFRWNYGNHWIGDELKSKLTWSGFAPIQHSVQINSLDFQGHDSQEMKESSYWRQHLKSAAKPLDVLVSCDNGVFEELLSGELTDVDDDDMLHVRLKADSQCNPLFKSGLIVRCYSAR